MMSAIALVLLTAAQGRMCVGQAAAAANAKAALGQGVVLDRVVAVVNDDVILESDVDEERRFEEVQPYRATSAFSRDTAIERLVDRALILQQAALEPEDAVSDQELDAQLLTLRKDIPACKQYHCETDAGWEKFVADHGFTLEEVRDRWRVRMEVLRFIEERFRMGIRIEQAEIDEYYQKTLLPAYQKDKVTPPAEATISDRIQEILLQQQVTDLMNDWLKTLRAQGSVRIVKAGEAMP